MNNVETETSTIRQSALPKVTFNNVTYTLMLAALWAISLWGFWDKGVYAFGINAVVFVLVSLFVIDRINKKSIFYSLQNLSWHLPLFAVAISYLFYENPFLKVCNILFVPATCGLLIARASLQSPDLIFTGFLQLLGTILRSLFLPQLCLFYSVVQHFKWVSRGEHYLLILRDPRIKSITKGMLALGALAFIVVIPLLSSADTAFSSTFDAIYTGIGQWFDELFEQEYILRLISIPLISIVLIATIVAWTTPITIRSQDSNSRDPISAGILLGGIILIYGLFIWIQCERLWIGTLPITFQDTENYVKSGFWQLVALSALNIVLVSLYFQRTIVSVQILLGAFLVASLLLLCSAAHRMYLYVTLYGFSHEKLYASYTVIYCLMIFTIIAVAFCKQNSLNIIKTTVHVFLWMYGLLNLFPSEYFIARTNLARSRQPDSRIHLMDLSMLSADALPFIRTHRADLRSSATTSAAWIRVDKWIKKEQLFISERPWYECNLACITNARSHGESPDD